MVDGVERKTKAVRTQGDQRLAAQTFSEDGDGENAGLLFASPLVRYAMCLRSWYGGDYRGGCAHSYVHPCHCQDSLSFVRQHPLVTWLSVKAQQHCPSHSHSPPLPSCGDMCSHHLTVDDEIHLTVDDEWEADAPAGTSVIDVLADVVATVWCVLQLLAFVVNVRQAVVLTRLPLCIEVAPAHPVSETLTASVDYHCGRCVTNARQQW